MRDARRFPNIPYHRQWHIGRRCTDAARFSALRLFIVDFQADRVSTAGNISEIDINQLFQPCNFEIARHNQRRCIGAIICLMKGACIIKRGAIQIFNRTDAGAAHGQHVKRIFRDHKPLKPAIRRGKHTLAQLFFYDGAFFFEHFIIHHRKRHTFTMRPKHCFKILRWNRLVIIRPINPI